MSFTTEIQNATILCFDSLPITDKRLLGFSDLLFSPSLLITPRRLWSPGRHWSYMQSGLPCNAQPHRETSATHWHSLALALKWLSHWLLPSCSPVSPRISVLVFSFLNSWSVNDPISTTLLIPPALPFTALWGCSQSCASSQASGQEAMSHQGPQLRSGGKLMWGLQKGSLTGGQVIAQDTFASADHIYKPKGTVFFLLHFLSLTVGTSPTATLPWWTSHGGAWIS